MATLTMKKMSMVFFSLFITLSLFPSPSSSRTTPISYSEHCSSVVPESTPTVPDHSTFRSLRRTTAYYTVNGGGGADTDSSIFASDYSKHIEFRPTRNSHRTADPSVYQIEASVVFTSLEAYTYLNQTRHPRPGSLRFGLNGFWSEASGKLCMVGSANWYSPEGKTLQLDAVLKLTYATNLTILNSLFSGTLESLSPSDDNSNYFDPISILGYSTSYRYAYTLVSEESGSGCSGGIDIPPKSLLSLEESSFCDAVSSRFDGFELEYEKQCDSAKNCNPFGGNIRFLPRRMSMFQIECSNDKQKLRYLISFSNSSYGRYYKPFDPKMSLIGEGLWDREKNQMCISACRILNVTESSWGNAQVGDCSIRLSLGFPATLSIRSTSNTVGSIWTNKKANEPGYFERIKFQSWGGRMVDVRGLKYESTETKRVQALCPLKMPGKNKKAIYPDGYSNDMKFDVSISSSEGRSSWGSAVPVSMDNRLFEEYMVVGLDSWTPEASSMDSYMVAQSPVAEAMIVNVSPINISYKISIETLGGFVLHMPLSPDSKVEIFAEGIYDTQTGYLCMVGCRKLSSSTRKSIRTGDVDCEILLNFWFPQINSKTGGVIKGTIESMRSQSDSLYFEHFNMSSTTICTIEAKQSIWRMDLEIVMVLISNTLACLFVRLQILYVKRNRNVLPFNSIVMLVILSLGHMVPLVLNFEAMFLGARDGNKVLVESGGWLEVNEVVVRVITLAAFLLQTRLLQLAWSSRLAEGNQKGLWASEIKALLVAVPSYIAGGLITLFVNFNNNSYGSGYRQYSLLWDLRSYAGLVLDGFLFPQILLNMFQSSREKALSHSFYIGTTSVRVLPHAYDLYRIHNYVPQHFNQSYIFANPTADFYSTAWDVIIPCGGLMFASIIFLQQRFGGRVVVPRKFRELEAYEEVPAVRW